MKPEDQKWWTMKKEIKEKMERMLKNNSLSPHTKRILKKFDALLFVLQHGTVSKLCGASQKPLGKSSWTWDSTSQWNSRATTVRWERVLSRAKNLNK